MLLLISYAAHCYRPTKPCADDNLTGRSAALFPVVPSIVGTAIGGAV
ncbi:hypothetical protein [Salinicola sp. CR57]|nr:hypothetical protein [Salinicola sp. CR57]